MAAYGGKLLIIDEIHKAPNFSLELKTIYDFLDIRVIFSGSSALEIENSKVDLSRRVLFYKLHSLSFREFLAIKFDINLPPYTLNEILNHHQDFALDILKRFKPLEYFKAYKEFGVYPFFTEGELGYNLRLNEIINIILDSEVATIYNVDSDKINTIRKLLHLLCSSVPLELNIPQKGDFMVNDKYTFEIGGKNKDFSQIKDIENSYVVADEMEVGFGNKIPLWLFGLLY
ncbi:MAG: AAA family ATPase [Arcobacter sp.]|nr:AAA family ATPase [Arcobacter sp.]